MTTAAREIFRSAEVCELTELQPYVLRSWEKEFPGLGQPAGAAGRVYRRPDLDLVLRIKALVFGEGLTLAGARRRLEEEQQEQSGVRVLAEEIFSDSARDRLRHVRSGLEGILQLLNRDAARSPELTLVAPRATARATTTRKRQAS